MYKRPFIDYALVRMLPAAWCMATIWWMSDQEKLPQPPGFSMDVWSVLGHFTMFGLLGISIWYGLGMNSQLFDRERRIWAIGIATAYGVLDELHQRHVPGRNADPFDVLVDFLGATTFVLLIPRLADRWTR